MDLTLGSIAYFVRPVNNRCQVAKIASKFSFGSLIISQEGSFQPVGCAVLLRDQIKYDTIHG